MIERSGSFTLKNVPAAGFTRNGANFLLLENVARERVQSLRKLSRGKEDREREEEEKREKQQPHPRR